MARATNGAQITKRVEERLSHIEKQLARVLEAVSEITDASVARRKGVTTGECRVDADEYR